MDRTRDDFVFHGHECLVGEDRYDARLGAVLWEGSVDLSAPGYVGTFRYRLGDSGDAIPKIGVRGADSSFLLTAAAQRIPVAIDAVAAVDGS